MNLVPPSISPQGRKKINYAIENFEFGLNATELKRQSINNGFAHFDWSELIASMRRITNNNKNAAFLYIRAWPQLQQYAPDP